jgi:hemerythrin
MTVLQWREEFSVGIEEIRTLQQDLHAGADTDRIIDVLGEIYNQIAAHFALEEKMMRTTHYPALPEHKQDHETLLDDLRDIMDEVEDDGVLDETQLTDDLDRWFSDHFKTHDAKLHHSAHG